MTKKYCNNITCIIQLKCLIADELANAENSAVLQDAVSTSKCVNKIEKRLTAYS